jgi:hypothetical protein
MKNETRFRSLLSFIVAGLFFASTSLNAHHGGAVYDLTQEVTFRGEVTQFRFVYPHVLVYFSVEGEGGEIVEWSGEMTTPNRLARGVGGGGASNIVPWTTETLRPGDAIEISGEIARNGAPSMRIRGIIDANGVALLGGNSPGRVAGSVATEMVQIEQSVSGPNLTGMWMRRYNASWQNYSFTEDPPAMTAWARERFDDSKPTFGSRGVAVGATNDPAYQCLPPGVPRIYAHPAPFEIIQTPNRVMLSYEYQHWVRQVYTDGREHRQGRPPSWMGESIGYWDDDVLVIETRNFNDKTWIDRRGLPHSDQLRVTERVQRSGENELVIDITVEDPVAYPEPWTVRRVFQAVDWRLEESVCLDDQSFTEFEQAVIDFENDQTRN